MLQDIQPKQFDNRFLRDAPKPEDSALVYRDGKALLQVQNGVMGFPSLGSLPPCQMVRSLFRIDKEQFVLYEGEPDSLPEGFDWYPSSEYRWFTPMDRLFACAAGHSLSRWYRDNRFCGRCGGETIPGETERSLVCPSCGSVRYPKICPAVIVAVRNGDRLLVTRYRGRAYKGAALIAGFAEIGEPIEDTVRREVWEEAGLKVKNITYYKSQPWVLTDSLLFGFVCDVDGDPEIRLQEDELSAGNWIAREDLPVDTAHVSLTAEMIEQFRNGVL